MILKYKNREVEIDIELPYSKQLCDLYIARGNYIDGALEDLTNEELDELQDLYATELDLYGAQNGCFD